MLRFDKEAHADPRLIHNLEHLYLLDSVPSDTRMREILDGVEPDALRPAFEALQGELKRGMVLEKFTVLEGRYLLAVDGTGQFASTKISCPHCCVKKPAGVTPKPVNGAPAATKSLGKYCSV